MATRASTRVKRPRTQHSSLARVGKSATAKRRRVARTPTKRLARIPAWAPYMLGEGYRELYLAHKTNNNPKWAAFKEACRKAFRHRARVKACDPTCTTPNRARELRRGGLSAFCKRANHRPRASSGFAAQARAANPKLAELSPESHRLAVMRERTQRARLAERTYTGHTTSIPASELNVSLLRDWLALELDSTPHITEALLEKLESPDAELAWSYWKHHNMGRLFADPWESLASLNRKARAVLCFGTLVRDLDMSCCHHRIALALGERYKVPGLERLHEYVADPTAWRQRIARDASISERDAKLAGVIFMNTGCMSTWISACEYAPQLTPALRSELKELSACCTRIRDATLRREGESLPATLRGAHARTRWSYVLCDHEDQALRAIWSAVSQLGAKIVMLVYDGLMLLPGRARRCTLEAAATQAASNALGCFMPCVIKPMKLPKAMRVVTDLRAKNAKLKLGRANDKRALKLCRAQIKTLKSQLRD